MTGTFEKSQSLPSDLRNVGFTTAIAEVARIDLGVEKRQTLANQ